jgi:hypothetical protein
MQVPAHIAARVASRGGVKSAVQAALLSDGFSYPKISTRASRYRLVEDGTETVVGTTLDVVVVGSNPKVSKIWYSKPYDGSDGVRPDCFSNDGITPDASVEKPFHPNCAACPNNVLGSKLTPTGQKSKICGDQRHLAVVPSADPTKVYGLTVPISGMKGLREYIKDLSNYGLIPEEVVTELGFDDAASYPKITFKQKGFVGEKAIKVVEEICLSPEILNVTRQENSQARLPAPMAAAAAAIAAPVAQAPQGGGEDDDGYAVAPAAPAPAPAPVVDDPDPRPAKAPKAAKATPPPAPPVVEGGDPLASMEEKLSALFS